MMSTFKNTPANMNETCPTANKKTSKSLSNTRPSHANGLHQTKHFLTNTLAQFRQLHWTPLTNTGVTFRQICPTEKKN